MFKKIFFYLALGLFSFILIIGCGPKSIQDARDAVSQSKLYYRSAVGLYKKLINQGGDLDRLHFELGEVYFNQGDFTSAAEEFKNTNDPTAKKYLAVSYYRMGNFTDALDIFSRNEPFDEEAIYYYGLTCEKLNLFDRALENYKKIKAEEFISFANERVSRIEKQENTLKIKDIDQGISKIIEDAPAQEAYPQAGALILLCDEKVEVTPQNTQVSSLHYLVKILNERGKESFSETHIDYDSTYEKVELEYARTIKPDGTIAEVGSKNTRDVSKYLNFPLYSNVRVFIISFPEIAEEAVIEYKIKIYKNQLINKKDFVIDYPLQTSEPILAASFQIGLPAGRNPRIKILNEGYNNFKADLNPRIEEKDNCLIYAWKFKDIPQIIPESNMPPVTIITPALLISTFDSWKDIYNWWWQLAKNKIIADTAIKSEVKELIENKNSDEAKIRAIYNFCAQKIRYVAVEYGQAGYEPHAACDIFKNKYGDCKDQAVLLVTMLKEAGLESWPVLIPTEECYNLNDDFPSVIFNHCIAAVLLDKEVIFLDPTAQTCSFGDLPAGDQNRRVLIIREDSYQVLDTPLYPSGHNLLKQSLKIKINNDETISGEKEVFTSGVYSQGQRYWLVYTQPELIEETLNSKIQEISIGAKLENYNIENRDNLDLPITLNYSFKGPEYFTLAGPVRIMPQLASLDTSLIAKDIRRYPIEFDILDSREIISEISIPLNFTVKYIPENVAQDSPWLKFNAEYIHENGKIVFKQKLELKNKSVSVKDYINFKTFLEDLAKRIKQRVVLEKEN